MARNEMFADPEPLDEDDAEVKEEMFELQKCMGLTPDDLSGQLKRSVRSTQHDWPLQKIDLDTIAYATN
jgi:hypothetical protein